MKIIGRLFGLVSIAAFMVATAHAQQVEAPGQGIPPAKNEAKDKNASYVSSLNSKFGTHIHYDGVKSRRAIESFDIDCRAPDKRKLPLKNALLGGLSELEGRLDYYVQTAQGETRVVAALRGDDRGQVLLVINKWGELHSNSAEAILNMCYGSHGPIWKMAAL